MNPLEFIFTLIERYVPVTPGRFEALKQKAKEWYVSEEAKSSAIGKFVVEKGEIWYVQIGLAIFYLFAAQSFRDMMNGGNNGEQTI